MIPQPVYLHDRSSEQGLSAKDIQCALEIVGLVRVSCIMSEGEQPGTFVRQFRQGLNRYGMTRLIGAHDQQPDAAEMLE